MIYISFILEPYAFVEPRLANSLVFFVTQQSMVLEGHTARIQNLFIDITVVVTPFEVQELRGNSCRVLNGSIAVSRMLLGVGNPILKILASSSVVSL